MIVTEENAKKLQRIFKLSDPTYFERKVGKKLKLVRSTFMEQTCWILTYQFEGESAVAFVIAKPNKAFFRDLLAMSDGESLTPQGWHIEPKAINSDMWVATPPEEAEIAYSIGSKDALPRPRDLEEVILSQRKEDSISRLNSLVVTEENYEALADSFKLASAEIFRKNIGNTVTLVQALYNGDSQEWTLSYEWEENRDYFWLMTRDSSTMQKIKEVSDGKLIPKSQLLS